MNCKEVSLLIEEFYDGELDLGLKSSVEEHITICPLCNADFNRVAMLDQLLEKSSTPPPASVLLDQKLMKAFESQYKKTSTSPAGWKRIFVGSVSIPKSAFAAAMVLIAVLVTAANFIGGYTVTPSEIIVISSEPLPAVSIPLPPETTEKTKIVEIPVIKERVVTRVVYVERQNSGAIKPQKALLAQNGTDENKQNQIVKEDKSNLAMNGAVEDGGYVTRANLVGFQPAAELKTRIIREDKTNEK